MNRLAEYVSNYYGDAAFHGTLEIIKSKGTNCRVLNLSNIPLRVHPQFAAAVDLAPVTYSALEIGVSRCATQRVLLMGRCSAMAVEVS